MEVSESCEISGHPVGLEAGGDAVPPRYIEGASPETAAHRRGDLVYLPGPFFLDALDVGLDHISRRHIGSIHPITDLGQAQTEPSKENDPL